MNLSLKKFSLMLALFCLLTTIFLMCTVPPVSRDALTHHLAVPKLYLQNGGILELPDIIPSYYPQLINLIYCIPMMFGNDIAPKYIHFSFALLTALLIFHHLKQKTGWFLAALSAMFFLSLPIIIKLSVTVYVDLGLIFFSTASLLSLIKWHEKQFKIQWLLISAIFCGLALGTKYNGLITCFLLAIFIPIIYLRGLRFSSLEKQSPKDRQGKAIGYAVVFLVISMMVFSPWMIKNYKWTSNPIYPLYDDFFNPKNTLTQARETTPLMNHFLIRKYIFKESWIETAVIPLRIFFQGEDDNPKFFDGRLNPLMFFLPFLAFFFNKKNSGNDHFSQKILLAFSGLYILIVFFKQDMRIRWIGPSIPPLVILSACGMKNIVQYFKDKTIRLSKNRAVLFNSAKYFFFMVVFLTAGLNAVYIQDLFKKISPLAYITGQISRSEYIKKHRPEYAALEFANKTLGRNTKILAFFLGNRSYYSKHDIRFDYSEFKRLVQNSQNAEDIFLGLRGQNFTDLIINYPQFNDWADKGFNLDEKKRINDFFNTFLKRTFTQSSHGLYQLAPS